MNSTASDPKLEQFYEAHILDKYNLNLNHISWEGHSEFDIDSSVHYFSIGDTSYVLLFEDAAGTAQHKLTDNAVAPHETPALVKPIDATYPNVYYQHEHDTYYEPDVTGTFTLFRT